MPSTLWLKIWNLFLLTLWLVDPVQRKWIKRAIALGASTTVVALLLIRTLPDIAWGQKEKTELEKPTVQVKTDIADKSIGGVSDHSAALLLPRPPSTEQLNRYPSKTKQFGDLAQSISTNTERLPPKQKESTETFPSAKNPERFLGREIKQPLIVAPSQKPLVETSAPPKPSNTTDILEVRSQIDGTSVKSTETGHGPSSSLPPASHVKERFTSSDFAKEAEGRTLLRILEHGSGPEVEIAWPVSMIQRRSLYRLLETCYGMEIALMDSNGGLYRSVGKAGQPWQPNLDRYSGIVRQPSGSLTPDEQIIIDRIYQYHGGLHLAENVRLFPRRLDALLLGGLKMIIGDKYAGISVIRAHYRREGDSVLVENISIDGRSVFGQISLLNANRHCPSGAWS